MKKKLFVIFNDFLLILPYPIRKIILDMLTLFPYSIIYPETVMVEVTNHCNLNCPLCPVGNKTVKRKKGWIKLDNFKKIVNEIKLFTKTIIINFAGETLLHPKIGEIINYAESNGIRVFVGTNGTLDKTDEILKSGLSEIMFALDGATRSTYENYRKGGNFNEVLKNIRKISERKQQLGLKKPKIIIQYVVRKDNEKELPLIIELAKKIGVDRLDLKTLFIFDAIQINKDKPEVKSLIEKYLPTNVKYTRYRLKNGKLILNKAPLCAWVFGTTILYNGDVILCCSDYSGINKVGNIFSNGGFKKIWKSKKYTEARKKIIKGEIELCKVCPYSHSKHISKISFSKNSSYTSMV